jgi:ankyrin repeat protein
MKHLLLTTIAAVLLVGCGPPKPPDISIHEAAYKGNIEAAKQHLANGADVNAKDEDGWSVLDMALASKNEEIITFIKTSGGHSNADKSIFVASGIGNIQAVQQHFASGVDVNAKSEVHGWTPLHYAGDQIEVAEYLLEKDARVNAVDFEGETPLDNAISWRDSETADLLRKHGGKTGEELKAEGK